MKKICFVTAARSEYGLLKWLMMDVDKNPNFEMQLIVTGGHLVKEQGHTIDQIKEDGFSISYIVDAKLDTETTTKTAESMGRIAEGFAKAFEKLEPDYVVVLGDRYELLPICNTAFVMGIPIIHLSGGDVTAGAIDDGIRNAVTMLADYHFPGVQTSAENVIRMRGTDKNVWAVGEPGLDAFNREKLWSRSDLADNLGLDEEKNWGLMTYHAETRETVEYNLNVAKMCVEELLAHNNLQTVITYANADVGGKQINEYMEDCAKKYSDSIKVVPSLGSLRYLSFMKQVRIVIGNSSSGIVEAPFMNIPVVNIGNRQEGRYLCGNVFQCEANPEDIKNKIDIALQYNEKPTDLKYWGDGHTSEKIIKIMQEEL